MDGIKNLTRLPPAREPGVQRTEASAGTPAQSGPAGDGKQAGAERVTLTDAARSLLQLRGAGSEAAPVDRARIEALRAAIADGSYEIDVDRIAQQLIRMERGA